MSADVTTGLSRDDLAALRAADNLSFHHHRADNRYGHMIRAYLRGGPIYSAREQRLFPVTDSALGRVRDIAVESAIFDHSGPTGIGRSAFSSVSAGHRRIATVLKLLRVGDKIRMVWTAENNTPNHEAVGFHADELEIRVQGAGRRDLTFPIAYSVGPDNSARMIRREG